MEFNIKENKLPVIYLEIDEDDETTGVDTISFVSNPATQTEWHKFSNQTFHFQKDDMKKVVTSVVMLAETPIYRKSETLGEYYVKFSSETVFSMMKKYFEQNKIHRVNEHHNSGKMVDKVSMIESYIVGDRVKSELYPDIPEGSWVASFAIHDDEYWNEVIMSDEFGGFSLEGSFTEKFEQDYLYESCKAILESDIDEEEMEKKIKEFLNIK